MDSGLDLNTEPIGAMCPLTPLSVEAGTSIRRALQILREHGRGELLVCRDGALCGIFTERDALRVLAKQGDFDEPIDREMTPDPVALRDDSTIGEAVTTMAANGFRRLPVVDPVGKPTGLVNVTGVVHWLVEFFPKAVYNLPPVPRPTTQEREGS